MELGIQALILSFQLVGRLQRGQLFSSLFAAHSPVAVNPSPGYILSDPLLSRLGDI